MTREEKLDWLYRLRGEIYVYMPKEWIIPMDNALEAAINTLAQEPKSPCDLCRYNPPSSCNGKPCTMCPAQATERFKDKLENGYFRKRGEV